MAVCIGLTVGVFLEGCLNWRGKPKPENTCHLSLVSIATTNATEKQAGGSLHFTARLQP